MRLLLAAVAALFVTSTALADGWKTDPTWYDGLVEKATYDAERVIYGKPRSYEAVVFTNKEQHDRKTLTKSEKSTDTIEVFKHNHVEVVPTPNYDYKFATTSHLTTDNLLLTRLDATSQEFCGTSVKQYLLQVVPGNSAGMLDYWSFSYMPEEGRKTARIDNATAVAEDSLPLYLRDYDFQSKPTVSLQLLPTQKSNRHVPHEPLAAQVRYAGEDGDSHKLEVVVDGKVRGTYWFAKDRLHVMTRHQSADGTHWKLKNLDRVNYWTRNE
jgi:hypothetical protein